MGSIVASPGVDADESQCFITSFHRRPACFLATDRGGCHGTLWSPKSRTGGALRSSAAIVAALAPDLHQGPPTPAFRRLTPLT
ncbi:MAG: hypothetical protein ACT4P7_17230 [Gemmatimonadaceae bacterium]